METEPTSGAQWTAQGDLKRGSSTPRTNSLGWLCKRMDTLFQLQLRRYNGSWRGGLFHGRGVWNEGGHTYTGGFLYGKVKQSSASKLVFKNKFPLQCIVVENLHRFNIWQSSTVKRSQKRVEFVMGNSLSSSHFSVIQAWHLSRATFNVKSCNKKKAQLIQFYETLSSPKRIRNDKWWKESWFPPNEWDTPAKGLRNAHIANA